MLLDHSRNLGLMQRINILADHAQFISQVERRGNNPDPSLIQLDEVMGVFP